MNERLQTETRFEIEGEVNSKLASPLGRSNACSISYNNTIYKNNNNNDDFMSVCTCG